jgi:hypothetical protein
MAKLERERSLPPLPGAEVKVFQLAKSPVAEAARTIESLFGAQTLRVATDDRTNSLIVLGAAESLASVEALLTRMDSQNTARAKAPGQPSVQPAAGTPRSLLLRIFWLADGLPSDELQNPDEFLPKSVLSAVARLGLSGPRLVTQTVNSLAVGDEGAVDFGISVPAVLFKQPANLNCTGHMHSTADQSRIGLDMRISVGGPAINCELSGSL